MNKLIIGLGVACLATQVLAELPAKEYESLSKASAQWVRTYNQNDWAALADLFTKDAVMMPPNGPAIIGREAIAAWEQANETGFQISFNVQSIQGSGDIAYLRGQSCVFIPLSEDEVGVDVGKYLEVRRRQSNGDWLIEADVFNSDLPVGADLLESCPF